MMVSPSHRMLLIEPHDLLHFDTTEVLVATKYLAGRPVTYIHLLFDAHEIINADGVWTESFQPADRTLRHMDQTQRAEIEALFPELDAVAGFAAARLTLKAHEAQVLFAA